jgi:putative ABC transport system permease protein
MEKLVRDIGYAMRMIKRKPGFSAVVLATLALGVGANTAVFSVVHTVLLSKLPYDDPDTVVMVWNRNLEENRPEISLTPGEFIDYKENDQLAGLAGIDPVNFNLGEGDEPAQVAGGCASANYFSLLGANPLMGRTFFPDEDQPGKSQVVVLSHGLWQGRFGSDPDIIGRKLTIYLAPEIVPRTPPSSDPSGDVYTVIGVMRPDFRMPWVSAELWIPLVFDRENLERSQNNIYTIGRLKPGATMQQAEDQLKAIANRLAEQYPETNRGKTVYVSPMREQDVGDIRPTLTMLSIGVAFVLLIACANVANLLLSRSSEREREVAVRAALGASRMRLFRQLLTESIFLAVIGGVLGLLLAYWATSTLVSLSPGNVPRIKDVSINRTVLVVTFGISVLTGIIFGLAPALHLSKSNLNDSLKEGARAGAASPRRHLLRRLLVITEMSMALMLLIGAGLIAKSFVQLRSVDMGFNPRNVVTAQISLSYSKYQDRGRQTEYFRQVLERMRSVPGVQSAGLINIIPVTGSDQYTPILAQGQSEVPGETPSLPVRTVSTGFFSAMGIPIVSGEDFREENYQRFRFIVNEAFARRYFGNEDAVGKRLAMGPPAARSPYIPIIGVIKDVRQYVEEQAQPTVYIPYISQLHMTMAVSTTLDPAAVEGIIRREAYQVDKEQPVYNIMTMEQRVASGDALAQARFRTILLIAFGATALVLAAVGLYGVMASSVNQRTHEIGVRMALGARRADVFRLIIGESVLLALIGVGLGLIAAFTLMRLISTLLYGVGTTDLTIFAGTSIALTLIAAFAGYLPARRATRVSPITALRYE